MAQHYLWFVTILAFFGTNCVAQEIRLLSSASQIEIGQSATISVVVDSPAKLPAGVAVAITLPDNLMLDGTPARTWYEQKWKDVSILPRLTGTELQLAAALKGTDAPCEGPCTIATFDVKATKNGTFQIQFVVSKTEALTADQQAISFAKLTGTMIQVGDGGVDSDTDSIPDDIEESLGLDPGKADTDGDGTPDADEDFDGDGLSNGEELDQEFDPTLFVGDMNGDRTITGADATRILQFLAELRDQSSLGRGPDVSNDGNITGADATRILQILAGLRTQSSVQR